MNDRIGNGAGSSTTSLSSLFDAQAVSIPKRLEELGYIGPTGIGWCPMHEQSGEHGPSFSATTDENGRDLLHCFGGCGQRELFEHVTRAIRENTLPICSATHPPSTGSGWGKSYGSRVSVWSVRDQPTYGDWCWYTSREDVPYETELHVYRDVAGNNVVAKQRWSDKHFLWLHWRVDNWRLGLRDGSIVPPLYNSDLITASPDATVWAVEGEKDADRLVGLGLVATSTHNVRPDAFQVLADRAVVVVPDDDAAGHHAARSFALGAARAGAKDVRVMAPLGDGAGRGFDVSDFLDAGGDVDQLRRRAGEAEPEKVAEATEPSQGVVDDDRRSSWSEVNLTRYLDNPVQPKPTVLQRDDGPCLLYPGETAWVFGEPGAGKTWFAALASAQCVKRGEHVVWLDFESQGAAAVSRMVVLGCSADELRKFFHLVEPETAFTEQARPDLNGLTEYGPTLVIFDAANDVLTLQGGRLNDVDTIAKFDTMLLLPFKRAGAAVVVIDHVAKSAESRGLWPINSGHKKACSTVAYSLVARKQFRPDREGASQIVVAKDRHGSAPAMLGETAGYLVLRGGEFSVSPRLGLAELASEADVGTDHTAVVIAAVENEPGEYSVVALAEKLADDCGESVSTWRRRIGSVLNVDPPVLVKDGAKLRPAAGEDVEP